MLETENDRLQKIIVVCNIHLQRLSDAYSKTADIFPMSEERYCCLSLEQIAFIDQYIFRFAKLQDTIGDKLFKQILVASDEQVESMSFRDILNKIEKFGIIRDRNEWIQMREIRNDVSHEYPVISEDTIHALNSIFHLKGKIENIYLSCLQYLQK
jgi:nucleotidyltransferase substrate binding protein (TIGR01987 family)